MMDQQILQAVAVAAFVHDLGKFADRARAVGGSGPDTTGYDGRDTHARHTEQALRALFPGRQLDRHIGGEAGPTVLSMACRLRDPGNIYDHLIAQADQIASGHEHTAEEYRPEEDAAARQEARQTPLVSILSRVRLKNTAPPPPEDWRYRVTRAGTAGPPSAGSTFFPVKGTEYARVAVEKDYRTLWKEFVEAVRPASSTGGLDLFAHFPTLVHLCREFQWCLPASTGKQDLPDVSLFDHQKVTSALASCLYFYHASTNTLNEQDVLDRQQEKFILFCGDISGIQKFIYRISSKGAYRTLKGKSFYIQLLAEILVREFIDGFGLTETSIMYAGGGKFYLLLPNLPEVIDALDRLQDSVNRELLEKFNGDLYLRTGSQPLSADDLTRESGRTLYQAWDSLTRQLVYQDRQRYSTLAGNDYDSLFGIHPEDRLGSCEVCHQTMRSSDAAECSNCLDMKELGRQLGTAAWLAVSTESTAIRGSNPFKIHDRYFWLLPEPPAETTGNNILLFGINVPDFHTLPLKIESVAPVNCLPLSMGASHRFDATFDEIAQRSQSGFKRLGVLRMDVDNLGKVFSQGLENYQHDLPATTSRFHSLGRITTLSRQLSQFFGTVLQAIVTGSPEWRDRVTVVYSGGDDLFLLGAWDALPDVALEIRKQFSLFTCGNPSFGLSGGLVITGGKFPVYKSADLAGEAEAKAKQNITSIHDGAERTAKDSFTFFETPMHWREFETLTELRKKLLPVFSQKESSPLLRRLRDIYLSWQNGRDLLRRTGVRLTMEQIHEQSMADKWRWRMVYSLTRFSAAQNSATKEEIDKIQKFIVSPVTGTDKNGIELLGVLTRWCELKLR